MGYFLMTLSLGVGLLLLLTMDKKYHSIFNYTKMPGLGRIEQIVLIVLSSSILVMSGYLLHKFTSYIEVEKVEEVIIESDSLLVERAKVEVSFEDSVFNYIKFLDIKHPEVVLKQAKIESGNFKSKIFKENNNMFGMKIPFKRANTVQGENLGYAVYNTWQESIIDYALYQTYSAKGMTKEEYIQHLGKSYAEDINYKQKIK